MTEPYVPQVGHRVTATITGVVANVTRQHVALAMGFGDTRYIRLDSTWTRLPDPEPDWRPGDIVIDADGGIALRAANSPQPWWINGKLKAEDYLVRPLTRLVRETRP